MKSLTSCAYSSNQEFRAVLSTRTPFCISKPQSPLRIVSSDLPIFPIPPTITTTTTNPNPQDFILSIPTDQHAQAQSLLLSYTTLYATAPIRHPIQPGRLYHLYPRFRALSSAALLVLATSKAAHLDLSPKNIEHSPLGLPYPTLGAYAQSLLDTQNTSDLGDIVDALNLSLDWGEKHLNLTGDADLECGSWRVRSLGVGSAYEDWRLRAKERREGRRNAVAERGKRRGEREKERMVFERFGTSDVARLMSEAMEKGDMARVEVLRRRFQVEFDREFGGEWGAEVYELQAGSGLGVLSWDGWVNDSRDAPVGRVDLIV